MAAVGSRIETDPCNWRDRERKASVTLILYDTVQFDFLNDSFKGRHIGVIIQRRIYAKTSPRNVLIVLGLLFY